MSLIDEALKRAQEAGQAEKGRPGDRPWIPTPMPDAGLAARQRILRVAAVGGAAAVLIGAGLYFWLNRARPEPARQPELAPEAAAVAAVEPVATAALALPPTAAPRLEVTRPPVAAAEELAPAPAPPAPARPAQTLADGRSYVGSIAIPGGGKLELGGIVWSEFEPRALLNDRIVGVGAYVEGFTVSKIEEDRVALEKDGVTVFLSLK